MKKIHISLLALLLFVSARSIGQSETTPTRSVRFGVKAGINIANLTVKAEEQEGSPGSLLGIAGGVFATIPGRAGFSVQPELEYLGLGAKEKGTDSKLLFNYLALPILAKYSLEDAGFAAYLGPQISYLLSAKTKAGGVSEDAKGDVKSTDISGVVGVEYFLPVGVGLSARYQLGFTNIAKGASGGGSIKNKALTITLGYRF